MNEAPHLSSRQVDGSDVDTSQTTPTARQRCSPLTRQRRAVRLMAALAICAGSVTTGFVTTATSAHAAACAPTISSTVNGNGWYVHVNADLNSPRTGVTVNTSQRVTIDDQELNPSGAVTVSGYGTSAVIDHLAGLGWVSDLSQENTPYGYLAAQCSAEATVRSHGATRATNVGAPGNCTWGAYYQWYQREGSYPALTGNAYQWAASARATGWTVVDTAQANSIVVFQPGIEGASAIGHVAWVTAVNAQPDGLYVTFIEMNGTAGLYRWDVRTTKDVAGMSYILAP